MQSGARIAMIVFAKYENGFFRPLVDVSLPEGTIVEVRLPAEAAAASNESIETSPFAGMWKDRDDLGDSVDYINRLRRSLRAN
jgi:predicted DNA-binding antitoxin AbrB/MazE fold protein